MHANYYSLQWSGVEGRVRVVEPEPKARAIKSMVGRVLL